MGNALQEYLEKTEVFYEKYGGKTVVLARFIPIIRTFAPFVAGRHLVKHINVSGCSIWLKYFVFFASIRSFIDTSAFLETLYFFQSLIPEFTTCMANRCLPVRLC